MATSLALLVSPSILPSALPSVKPLAAAFFKVLA
jgi:hypothetical protein